VLNHAEAARSVDLGNGAWHELVADRTGAGQLDVAPYGVALVAGRVRAAVGAGAERGEGLADR
jgi:hypothetical protein